MGLKKVTLLQALAHLTDQVACLRHPLNSRLITTNSLVEELQGQHSFHAGLGAILGEVHPLCPVSLLILYAQQALTPFKSLGTVRVAAVVHESV